MGVAIYIELNREDPGFDTFVNGKAVAREREAITRITEALGLKDIFDLTSFESLDESLDLPDDLRDADSPWFDPQEGLSWVGHVIRHIEQHPASVADAERVLADLNEYVGLLRKAESVRAKWRFAMDI